MNKLYEKSQLRFSLVWIAFYVVSFSIADNLSLHLGTAKLVTAPLCVATVLVLVGWILRSGLGSQYGLCRIQGNLCSYLFFLPLVLLASTNLWGGVTLRSSPLEAALYVVSMLCVGLIEELLFRGFLFKALIRENRTQAILISSITFGIGHIVNLLNGAELLPTLLQILYAASIGFLFTIIFYKSGSLLPCIITHSTINSLSLFAGSQCRPLELITSVVLTVIPLFYALWLLKHEAQTTRPTEGA